MPLFVQPSDEVSKYNDVRQLLCSKLTGYSDGPRKLDFGTRMSLESHTRMISFKPSVEMRSDPQISLQSLDRSI